MKYYTADINGRSEFKWIGITSKTKDNTLRK
jgi:hypothetical protein